MWWICTRVVKGLIIVGVVSIGTSMVVGGIRGCFNRKRTDRDHPEPKDKNGEVIRSAQHLDDLSNKDVDLIRGYDSLKSWSIDNLLLERLIQQQGRFVFNSNALSGIKNLNDFIVSKGSDRTVGKYSTTFGANFFGRSMSPRKAIDLFFTEYNKNGMSMTAVYILGGAFVIGAQAARGGLKLGGGMTHGFSLFKMGNTRYSLDTVQGRSFPMLSLALGFYNPLRWGHIVDSACSSLRYDKPHARCKDGDLRILAPSTVFGSSKTIIKVVDACNMIGMTREECMSIVFCVIYHWIQKNHAGRKERHSFLEGLQGALMAIGMKRNTINNLYIHMLKTLEKDELRNPDKYITKVNPESMF